MQVSGASSTDPKSEAERRFRVLLPLPLAGAYDYRAPEDLELAPGDFVRVPLGKQTRIGVVWDGEPSSDGVAAEKLRDIEARLETPPMTPAMRRFVDWMSAYTMARPGAVLRLAISVPEALVPGRPRILYRPSAEPPEFRRTAARERVLALLADGPARAASDIAREAGVGTSVVRGLADLGVLEILEAPDAMAIDRPDPDLSGPRLSRTQKLAADDLAAKAAAGGFGVTLLDGVTGAGKTEVYFEAAAAALRAGRQVLVLLPEIALTAQFLERFEARFGVAPLEWHSDISRARRRRIWRAVAEGRAPVVVGARSALFLPFSAMGLIVVDEEHDGSFKQEDGVIYHARDMAVVRGRLEEAPVVLSSATPSLETVTNVEGGRYDRRHLPARHGGADLPHIAAVDLRLTPPERQSWLAPPLREAMTATLAAGEQSLLFLNRRGYAPLTLCRACGHRLDCPNCTAWLVEHRFARRLSCHHCGYWIALPESCPECGAEGRLAACGPGVERVLEEVAGLYPEARVEIMTSDTIWSPSAAAELVRRVRDHEIDILIGTQLVAKGHHFPKLTLVGVVDADLGLAGGDLRASERTYQLLHLVAGRAGRAERPGRVLLQTHHPDHPVMAALVEGNRDDFMAAEAAGRRTGSWPPFGRLAAVIVSGPDEAAVDGVAGGLGRTAPRSASVQVLGPAPAPLAILRGRHRRRLLVKASRGTRLQPLLAAWVKGVRAPNAVRVQIDIDPYGFL